MARKNRNKILVPEARKGMDELKAKVVGADHPSNAKFEAAEEVGVPLQKGYNGQLTSEQAGKIGGKLGGKHGQRTRKNGNRKSGKKAITFFQCYLIIKNRQVIENSAVFRFTALSLLTFLI